MPIPCPSCRELLVLGSLRCRICGADARGARGPVMLGPMDAFGHASVETWIARRAPRVYRRAVIVDRLGELSPAFLAWAREAPETRGPAPAVALEAAAEVAELVAEWVRLK